MADWSEEEVELAVADYFQMLETELDGRLYIKAEHWRELQAKLDHRTKASIEYKHHNISAALDERGLTWLKGYVPRHNYQRLIGPVVDRALATHPSLARRLGKPA